MAAILKNPAYAGAFVYGRTLWIRETTREGASRAKTPRPIEEWRIVVVKTDIPLTSTGRPMKESGAAIRDNRSRIHAHQNPRHAARR